MCIVKPPLKVPYISDLQSTAKHPVSIVPMYIFTCINGAKKYFMQANKRKNKTTILMQRPLTWRPSGRYKRFNGHFVRQTFTDKLSRAERKIYEHNQKNLRNLVPAKISYIKVHVFFIRTKYIRT